MRIAQIVCVFPPYKSGIGNVAYNFSQVIKKNGDEIITFTPDYGKQNNYSFEEKTSVKRLKPWLKYGNGAFSPQLLLHLNKFEIVILHYPFFGGAEIVWLAKKVLNYRFKLIIHYHMDVFKLPFLAKSLGLPAELIKLSLFKMADKVTCASLDYLKNSSLAEFYQKNRDKFIEIPFGVDTKKFRPNNYNCDLNSDNKIKSILFVGSLDRAHYFKGIEVLLKAVSGLRTKDWRLTIIGEGDLKPDYQKMAKQLKVENKVNFLGKIEDKELPLIYRRADLFILPSTTREEAFGLVLLEAMASGLPLIASDLPGVRSVFIDGVQGFLARPGDARDLQNKIEKIISNSNLLKKMSRNSRKLAETKYKAEIIEKNFLSILNGL